MPFIVIIMQLLFFLVVLYFAAYVLLELRITLISHKVERRRLSSIESPLSPLADFSPSVAILLPVYNESSVIEQLIEAVCRLEYPLNKLEILVLDDSTDATQEQAARLVTTHAAQGINIHYLQRGTRTGYKANNLSYGVSQSQAEFFAVFDADFLPPTDFLLRTIPCFLDPKLGYLQTGIGYANRDASFLTQFQAAEMQHQQYVTVGLCADGKMASLSGSSCVWRRACLESVGGWNATTITEDVDIGYRAQLSAWKYAYLKEVVSLSLLPETVSAFRVQRERWGRGLLHSAFKHGMGIFKGHMSTAKRLYAISMMFSSLLLVSIYCLFLLTLPLVWLTHFKGPVFIVVCLIFFILVGIWGIGNLLASQMWEALAKGHSIIKKLIALYCYIAMFLPMSLYYTVGGIRAFFGVYEEFNKTPKGNDEIGFNRPRIDSFLLYGEIFSFLYSCLTIVIALYKQYYILLPVNITACLAFGVMLHWGWREGARHAGR